VVSAKQLSLENLRPRQLFFGAEVAYLSGTEVVRPDRPPSEDFFSSVFRFRFRINRCR